MRVLVDSDALIDILSGVPAARDALSAARTRGDSLVSITPVRTEILRGVAQHDLRGAGELLGVLGWIDVDVSLADSAASLGRPYQRSHQGISITDLLLAAAVERVGGKLLTRNVRHFPMLPGLLPAY
jgi:predicted nucleic acid-binding protein